MTSRRSAHRAPGMSVRAVLLRGAALSVLLLGTVASVLPVLSSSGVETLTNTASPSNSTPPPSPATDTVSYEEKLKDIQQQNTQIREAAQDTSTENVTQGKAAATDARKKADEAVAALNTRVSAVEKRVKKRKADEKAAQQPPVYIPESCEEYSGNQAIGCALLGWAGYGLDQMDCLVKLWNKESGWRTTAANPSGAYGIPQAKPGSKMAEYGDDWQSNPETQIKWGLQYIKKRYGTPCKAWSTSQAQGWY